MILDTNAVSALFDERSPVAPLVADALTIELPVVVMGEYRYGVLGSTARLRLQALFLELVSLATILTIDADTAEQYAQIRHTLRRNGHPIPVNDVWIAALALQHGLPVLSRDAHFDIVPGVQRIGW